MELMTARWTDDRMDDLKHQVGALGQRMDAGFRELREEMGANQRETNARFDAMNARFDSIQRTMVQFGGALIGALVGLFAALVGLILTQL